jgi:hypothetical protein
VGGAGSPPDQVIAGDFVSFKSFTYTVLRFDHASLAVRVMGMPAVLDPSELYDANAERAYEQRQADEILRFQLLAQ